MNIFYKRKSRLFLFIILFGKTKFTDKIIIESNFISLDNNVITINPHRLIIIQDRKGKDLPVKFFLPFYNFIELDDTSYSNNYTINVLSISNIKYRGIILYFVYKEGEIYPVNYNEKESFINIIDN